MTVVITEPEVSVVVTESESGPDLVEVVTRDQIQVLQVDVTPEVIEVSTPGPQGPPGDPTLSALVLAAGKGFINHGSNANVMRPVGFASVEWLGSVEPNFATEGDTWREVV
jgi:hypothetical protein